GTPASKERGCPATSPPNLKCRMAVWSGTGGGASSSSPRQEHRQSKNKEQHKPESRPQKEARTGSPKKDNREKLVGFICLIILIHNLVINLLQGKQADKRAQTGKGAQESTPDGRTLT
ncbi:hypothetical protein ACMYZ8_11960, partial [Bacteroides sp. KG156]